MTVHWVTSADVGAISLYGTNGRANTWAKKHWVTDRGWTNPFTGSNSDIFLPPGSVGNGVKLTHDSAVSGAAQRATFRAFESASALATLVDPYPTVAQVGDTASTMLVSTTADATARPWWMLIGDFTGPDDSFFILAVQISTTSVEWTYYGKPYLDDPTDTHGWLVGIRNAANTLASSHSVAVASSATPNQKFYWQRSYDGTIKSTTSLFVAPYGGGGSGTIGVLQNTSAYATAPGAKLRRTPVMVGCSGNTGNAVTAGKNTPWRGILQNFWMPVHTAYTGITSADTSYDSAYDPLAEFIIFGMTFNATTISNGAIVLEKTDTWRPQGFP